MWKKQYSPKYSYLWQTIISLSIALLIPSTLFALTVVNRSYSELVRRNEEYYINVTDSFSSYFQDRITLMRNQALRIGLISKSTDNRLARNQIQLDAYYYKIAADTLKEYRTEFTYFNEIGIYYSGGDTIITSSFSYDMNSFIARHSKKTPEMERRLKALLTESYTDGIFVTSSFDLFDYRDAELFVGVPVEMYGAQKAVIFFVIRYGTLNMSYFDTHNAASVSVNIFDGENRLIYTNRPPEYMLLSDSAFGDFLVNASTQRMYLPYEDMHYTVLKSGGDQSAYSVVSMVPRSDIESNILIFYQTMQRTALLIAAALTVLLGLTVYVNYRPISKLVRGFRHANTGGEIKTIEQTIIRMQSRVEDQNTRLTDYMLGNLLYGIPIPPEEVFPLDTGGENGSLCVLTVADWKADVQQQADLARLVQEECGAMMYIVDIRDKAHTACIGILRTGSPAAFAQAVKQSLQRMYGCEYKTGLGMAVKSSDEIRKSYLNALFMMGLAEGGALQNDSSAAYLKGYPAEDIQRFLYFLRGGDYGNAIGMLGVLRECSERFDDDPVTGRYLWYDLLVASVKVIEEMELPDAKQEIQYLLFCASAAEFFDRLAHLAAMVCESFPGEEYALKKDVAAYIDDHFTLPNLSQPMVAAKFGISVHTLSRLFRERVGKNFSEYVISKRMEYAKELLLTTDMRVSEIANAVGLTDPNYFSRLFKAKTGQTPLVFRNRQAQDEE